MIRVAITIPDETVKGAEMSLGVWAVSPERFADFVDEFVLPDSFTTLGGTVAVTADWHAVDAFDRAETFRYVAQRYLEQEYGPLLVPFTVEIDGATAPDDPALPASTVF